MISKLPPDWVRCAQEGLSLSDPLPSSRWKEGTDAEPEREKQRQPMHQSSPAKEPTKGKGAPPAPRRVFLRSYHGAYLSASDGNVYCSLPRNQEGADPPVPHFAETWDIEFDPNGAAFLRSFYGRYLSTYVSSTVHITADQEYPGTTGRETFLPLMDDCSHTLGLISSDGHYIYADSQLHIVGTPTLPSLASTSTDAAPSTSVEQNPSDTVPLRSSVEFYRLMSTFSYYSWSCLLNANCR